MRLHDWVGGGWVELEFLGEGIAEGTQSRFGGRVRAVASDGVERQHGGGKDDVVCWLVGNVRTVLRRAEPGSQCGVGDIRRGEVVGVHLVVKSGEGGVDKEARDRDAGAAPDYGRGAVIVPGCGFIDDAGGFGRIGEVCADVVEALAGWLDGAFL